MIFFQKTPSKNVILLLIHSIFRGLSMRGLSVRNESIGFAVVCMEESTLL